MKRELDQKLCEKYPKIFANRHKPMTETAMCWGFDCGDGWYNIIDRLCGNIQSHIDWKEKTRQHAIEYNEMVTAARAGDLTALEAYISTYSSPYREKVKNEILGEGKLRHVPDSIPQVTADQVKEKFGTLRFYYTGGDEYIHGLSAMAESMSGVTCEECGSPGKVRTGGWLRALCDTHAEAAGYSSSDIDEEDDDGLEQEESTGC